MGHHFIQYMSIFLSSPSASRTSGASDLRTAFGQTKMETIDLCNFGVTWGILGFLMNYLTNFLDEIFWRNFQRIFWQFFWRIFWQFFDEFFDDFFDKFFNKIFFKFSQVFIISLDFLCLKLFIFWICLGKHHKTYL